MLMRLLAQLRVNLNVPSFPIHAIRFVYADQQFTFRQPNLFRVIRREEFDEALVQRACERGVELRQGEALLEIEQDGAG